MTDDFFRNRLDQMIALRHPLAVLANRMPRQEIEASLAQRWARQVKSGKKIEDLDLFSPLSGVAGGGVSNAGRPRLPKANRIELQQTYAKECQLQGYKAGRYAHARQFKRMRKVIKRQRTIVGRLQREVGRKMSTLSQAIQETLVQTLDKAKRLVTQTGIRKAVDNRAKLYS